MVGMNPVLIVLILVAGFVLWLLLSFLYRPVGRLFMRLWNGAEDAMKDEDKNDKRSSESEKE